MTQVQISSGLEAIAAKLHDAGAPNARELASKCVNLYEQLLSRRFDKVIELVAVFSREAAPTRLPVMSNLSGIYRQMPDSFADHPYFQKVVASQTGVRCDGLYILWCTLRQCWKFGAWDGRLAALAFCTGEERTPDGAKPWMVLKDDCLDSCPDTKRQRTE